MAKPAGAWTGIGAVALTLGFGLLVLQGLSELGKRVLWLRGRIEMTMHYEKPLQ